MLYPKIEEAILSLDAFKITKERKEILQRLINHIQSKKDARQTVNLNFICTHNSRRSHLSQVWAQTMANYFEITNVCCYSGGTEATVLYPMVAETLKRTGFKITTIHKGQNPIYAIKFSENSHPVIGFSKTYDHDFNPQSNFAAVMVCSEAEENCPFIANTEKRIAVTYEDPKAFDNTPQQVEKYHERSLQIATEMYYVFSSIK